MTDTKNTVSDEILAKIANASDANPRVGTNSGHGHVWKRPDGRRMRCGGPGMCRECSNDALLVQKPVDADTAKAMAIELQSLRASIPGGVGVQCCMCGKTGLSTIEGDGGTECQLEDGRWTCSEPCWEKAGGYGPDLSPAEGEPVAMTAETACKIAIDAIKGVPGYGDLKSEETGRDDDWRFRARLARSEALSSAHARIKLAFDKIHGALKENAL